jgi:hypothetical protein
MPGASFPSGFTFKLKAPSGAVVTVKWVKTASRMYTCGGFAMQAALYEDPVNGWHDGLATNRVTQNVDARSLRLMASLAATRVRAMGGGEPRYAWPVTRALLVDNDGSVRPRGGAGALRLLTGAQYLTTEVGVAPIGRHEDE